MSDGTTAPNGGRTRTIVDIQTETPITHTATSRARLNRFALVTAGHHFLLHVLPLREPDSRAALAGFVAAVAHAGLPGADIEAILLRCLAVLDGRAERRIPSLIDRYLTTPPSTAETSLARFSKCVEDQLRHHCITDGSVQEAIEIIRTSFSDSNLDPPAIARHVGVRLATLDVAFRKQLDCTVTHYIRAVRLEHAALLLVTTNKSIKEIWAAGGYNHHSNFDHDFKKNFGRSPRKFRERAIRPLAKRHYAAHEEHVPRNASEVRAVVAIVDDDEDTRATVGMYLRHEGYSVVLAATGAEGLYEVKRHTPTVLLLDYHLGDMDGLSFLRTLRQDMPGDSPAVALFTADWEVLDHSDKVHELNAMIASKLCDLDQIKELIVYLSANVPASFGGSAAHGMSRD